MVPIGVQSAVAALLRISSGVWSIGNVTFSNADKAGNAMSEDLILSGTFSGQPLGLANVKMI